MKNIFKYMAGVLVAGFAMTSCSPEDLREPMAISHKHRIILITLKLL